MAKAMDYVKNGRVVQGQQTFAVLVQSEADLANLDPYQYTPGTLAHTPGWADVWELDANGNWVADMSWSDTASRSISQLIQQLDKNATDMNTLKGEMSEFVEDNTNRVTSLTNTPIARGEVIEVVGIPTYVNDVTDYSEYAIADTGWYLFVRIAAKNGVEVAADTTVTGAAGFIKTVGEDHVDVAVHFGVTAESQVVTVDWGEDGYEETFVFKADDLAIRNLDYRTTFYVYDADEYATWTYDLTTDTTFDASKNYYTKDGDVYTLATVTAGEAVTENTYYNHSKVTISGLARNITYRLNTIVDCPMEFILPVIDDDTHGCWFEIRCRHAGEYSMTLVPPSSDVKVATEHTQKETAGMNMIDLHYTVIDGVKLWRFLNTHSSIPTEGA